MAHITLTDALKKPLARKIVDCPKCGEGDERAVGLNVCGLCECRFYVKGGRATLDSPFYRRIPGAGENT